MKKIFVVLIMLSVFVFFNIAMTAVDSPYLAVSSTFVLPERNVCVPIQYSTPGEINTIIFSIDYDTSVLNYLGVTWYGNRDMNWVQHDLNDTDGEIDIMLLNYTTEIPSGTLLCINFEVIPKTLKTFLGFSNDPSPSFGSLSGQSVPGMSTGGYVYIAKFDRNKITPIPPTK